MSGGLNPANPIAPRAPGATFPDGLDDTDVPLGTRRQVMVGMWNAIITDVVCNPTNPTDPLTKYLAKKYLLIEEDGDTWAYSAGHLVPMVGMMGAGGFGAGAEALESKVAGAAGEDLVTIYRGLPEGHPG